MMFSFGKCGQIGQISESFKVIHGIESATVII